MGKCNYKNLIVNVDELWLKGKNRPLYYKALTGHVKELLGIFHEENINLKNVNHRLIARSEAEFDNETIDALLKVPGIHSVIPAKIVELSYDAMIPAVLDEIGRLEKMPATFKVITKRVNKKFPMRSMDISRKIGGVVLSNFSQLKVDVHKPELLVEIRVIENGIFVSLSTNKRLGVGGLPFGTSGHLVTMLSGGLDSPVASYLMSKRGCRQTFVFFHAYPFVGDEVKEKIFDLTRVLGQYQRFSKLYIVPFGEFQKKVSKICYEEYRTLLFRKFMIDCSTRLAQKVNASAILTGDALGQVSSQTIGNISALDSAASLPIFRPLLGYNKMEIIELAQKIKTYDISIIPHDDACSLLAPKHPIIHPSNEYLERFNKEHPMDQEIEECLEKVEIYSVDLQGSIVKR